MVRKAHFASLLSGALLLLALSPWGVARGCDICGRECMGSCGDTRTFVTCCYNYLRKRGVGAAAAPLAPDYAQLVRSQVLALGPRASAPAAAAARTVPLAAPFYDD